MPTLKVTVLCARDLTIKDIVKRSSDPYIKLRVGKGQEKRTKTIFNNLNPDFDETILLDVQDPDNDVLFMEVWDKDMFSRILKQFFVVTVIADDFMGKCEVKIAHLKKHKPTSSFIQSLLTITKELTIDLKEVESGNITIVLQAEDFGADK